ncbi:MAG: ABC transporter substrate-binding protein, partial [Alphaproteobacteria bacterium]|nr:ABC transporter substrate-binding protein [Alphaproteobacteria bacterium]
MRAETGGRIALVASMLAALAFVSPAEAQKKNTPGVTDTEIKIGNTMPYSGPASAYGTIGRVEAAYFRKINDEGGVNGRKIVFITLDDGYSPPKTVEQIRRLVEQDEVAATFSNLGTATNTAVQGYLNARKVPQLFVSTGATKFGDPQHFPWTIGWQPNYQTDAKIYVKYLLATRPDAKVAILYQNDDFGKDYLQGIRAGLGDRASKMIVAEATYEITDGTIDSQIVTLQSSGADVLFNIATPKFAAMAIRKVYDIGWRPLHFLSNVSASVGAVLTPAGLEKSIGIITAGYIKDPTDPQFADDPAMKEWRAFMAKYYPEGDLRDAANVTGYSMAATLVEALKQCGDDLSRESIMRAAAHLDLSPGVLLPGIKITTSPTDFYPIKQARLRRFDGTTWVLFG